MRRQKKLPPHHPLAPEAWPRPRYGALWLVEEVIGSLNNAFWLAYHSCRRTNWTEGIATRGW